MNLHTKLGAYERWTACRRRDPRLEYSEARAHYVKARSGLIGGGVSHHLDKEFPLEPVVGYLTPE